MQAIITAIEQSNIGARTVAEAVRLELEAHTKLDDARHEENKQTLGIIAADVKILLASRQFTKGFWKALLLVGSTAGGLGGLIVAVIALWR